MERREIERLAAAVNKLCRQENDLTAARVSLAVGRAVLGIGSMLSWKKWLKATGWPSEVIERMAEAMVRGEEI